MVDKKSAFKIYGSYFVNRNDIEQKKVAVVAYGCNKTRLVPLEDLTTMRE